MSKKRVVVLFGGQSDEHSISCISAASLLRTIDRNRFEPIPIGITKQGLWIVNDDIDPRQWVLGGESLPTVELTENSRMVVLDISKGKDGFFTASQTDPDEELQFMGHIDAVFPVLHGPYGEDGTIQGMLDMIDVPYVGCGVLSSSVCMDKHYTKIVLQAAGVPVTPGLTLDARSLDAESHYKKNKTELEEAVEKAGLQYPLFVKPSRAGSSFGVSKVENPSQLAAAIDKAAPHDWRILIETAIVGREIECAVLSTNSRTDPRTSWPGEVVLDTRIDNSEAFYDFDSKYTDSTASHVEVPANLPSETLDQVRKVSAAAFSAVDGKGLARVDTFVRSNGEVVVNEINTMPGFTSISMWPLAWEASGLPYEKVITELIEGILHDDEGSSHLGIANDSWPSA